MPRIALTVDDVDAAFIDEIFGGRGAVRGVSATKVGTGQVALSLKLVLDVDSSCDGIEIPSTLVAKIPSPDAESRAAARMHLTYHKEVGFYTDLADLVTVPHPRHHHVAIDADSGDFTLVMDHVAGEVGDQIRGCSIGDAAAFAVAAAGLHAPTWDRVEELANPQWLPKPDPGGVVMRSQIFAMLLTGFQERYVERLDATTREIAEWLGANLVALTDSYRLPLCVVHGDYRIDNMLFNRSQDSVTATILDWQTVSFGRGPTDVAYGIGSGLLTDDRRRVETDLIDRYTAALRSSGVSCSDEDVRWDYRIGTMSGLAMAVIASQVVTSTERGDEMFAVMAERHAQQMIDNDIFSIVGG